MLRCTYTMTHQYVPSTVAFCTCSSTIAESYRLAWSLEKWAGSIPVLGSTVTVKAIVWVPLQDELMLGAISDP